VSARALAFLLVALTSTSAWASDLSGGVGLGYGRTNSWSSQDGAIDSSIWDWNANLAMSGSPFRPGLLQYAAALDYQAQRLRYRQGDGGLDNVGFRLSSALLQSSIVPISVYGTRAWTDFVTDAGSQRTGSTVSTNLGGSLALRPRGLPSLQAALSHTGADTTDPAGGQTSAATTALTVTADSATPTHSFGVQYGTSWSDGTFAESNYRAHTLGLQLVGILSPTLRLNVGERYALREPIRLSAQNPRFDDQAFNASLDFQTGQSKWKPSLLYQTDRALVELLDQPVRERTSHVGSARMMYRQSADTFAYADIGALYVHVRRPEGEERTQAATQSVGVATGHRWQRQRWGAGVTGTGSLALAEPTTGGLVLGHGGGGGANFDMASERWRLGTGYSASLSSGGISFEGYALQQQVQVVMEALLRGLMVRLSGQASASRRDDPVFGTSLSRSVTSTAEAAFSRTSFGLSGGLSDGLSQALSAGAPSDGLFLPADYNTRSLFGTFTATRLLLGNRAAFSLLARAMRTDQPGRPRSFEHGGHAVLSLAIGLFSLSIEDRLSRGGSGGVWTAANVVMVRLTRAFGMRL